MRSTLFGSYLTGIQRISPTTAGSFRGAWRGGRAAVNTARKRTRSGNGNGTDAEVEMVHQGKYAKHEWGGH